MTASAFRYHACPYCDQPLGDDAQAHIKAHDHHEMGSFRIAYVVELINLVTTLRRENADLQFTIIDHEDG